LSEKYIIKKLYYRYTKSKMLQTVYKIVSFTEIDYSVTYISYKIHSGVYLYIIHLLSLLDII